MQMSHVTYRHCKACYRCTLQPVTCALSSLLQVHCPAYYRCTGSLLQVNCMSVTGALAVCYRCTAGLLQVHYLTCYWRTEQPAHHCIHTRHVYLRVVTSCIAEHSTLKYFDGKQIFWCYTGMENTMISYWL